MWFWSSSLKNKVSLFWFFSFLINPTSKQYPVRLEFLPKYQPCIGKTLTLEVTEHVNDSTGQMEVTWDRWWLLGTDGSSILYILNIFQNIDAILQLTLTKSHHWIQQIPLSLLSLPLEDITCDASVVVH